MGGGMGGWMDGNSSSFLKSRMGLCPSFFFPWIPLERIPLSLVETSIAPDFYLKLSWIPGGTRGYFQQGQEGLKM